jgi:hypothetical protein
MKRLGILGIVLAIAVAAMAVPSAFAVRTEHGTGDVFHLVPSGGAPPVMAGAEVSGASASIRRTESGITINIRTVGLAPKHAYTVWVFEVGGTPVAPMFLTGHIIGNTGIGNFSGRLNLNPDTTKPVQEPLDGEFHCIIADHGVVDPSDLPGAISTPVPPFAPDGTQNWKQVVIFEP